MPIKPIPTYAVECDICHHCLTVNPNPSRPKAYAVAAFVTQSNARAAAASAHWTLAGHFLACPKCSPITGPTPTQTPASAVDVRTGLPRPPAGS